MSDETSRSSHAFVTVLTKENYMKWESKWKRTLMGATDHFRVLQRTKDPKGHHNPSRPTNAKEGKAWVRKVSGRARLLQPPQ